MNEDIKLNSCSCGGQASVHRDSQGWVWIECDDCGLKVCDFGSVEDASRWWNRTVFPIEAIEALDICYHALLPLIDIAEIYANDGTERSISKTQVAELINRVRND